MINTLELQLLEKSKGTILESIAQNVVRQPFQDVSNNSSKLTTLLLLVFTIALTAFLIYIPFAIYIKVGNDPATYKNGGGMAVQVMVIIFIIIYLSYISPFIYAALLLVLVLLFKLFN